MHLPYIVTRASFRHRCHLLDFFLLFIVLRVKYWLDCTFFQEICNLGRLKGG